MDRQLIKKKWRFTTILKFIVGGIVVFLILMSLFFTEGGSLLKVDTEKLIISEVKNSSFKEFIPVNGVILPIKTIYLDAVEGGRVEEIFVEDGVKLQRGDAIIKLANTDLELSLANQETAVFNLLTQMQISRNAARQNTIMKLNQETDVENIFREAERKYQLNKKLFDQGAIAFQEFKESENAFNYAVRKKKLTHEILNQDSIATQQELIQAQESYNRTQQALSIMRRKVEDLVVRAPIDGQLTSLDAEIGQNKNKGQRLGQIDVTSGYKVRVEIDEHYISRIYIGLIGDFNFGGKVYPLKIYKIYSQVSGGKFQVDMKFAGDIPLEIRRGQTLQIRLALSDETEAILLPRGAFYQQSGGNWVFRINEKGTSAYRVDVRLGRQNPEYYEVLSGLNVGDKVVTSSYENYSNTQELVLKGID